MLGPSLRMKKNRESPPPLSGTIKPVRIQFVRVYTNGLLVPYIFLSKLI